MEGLLLLFIVFGLMHEEKSFKISRFDGTLLAHFPRMCLKSCYGLAAPPAYALRQGHIEDTTVFKISPLTLIELFSVVHLTRNI